MRVVVAYDIEDDRVRTRVSKLLGRFGWRVQKSVFECLLDDQASLDHLSERLQALLDDPEEGDIRVYRLCESCFGKSFGLGDLERGSGGEPWIIV